MLPSVVMAAAGRCAGDKTARRVANPLCELGSKHAEVRAPAQAKFM